MKKSLLFASMAAIAMCANAKTEVYYFKYTDPELERQFDQMGTVYAISQNGEYAVITDEEMNEAFLWKKSDPSNLVLLNQTRNGKQDKLDVRGVNDNGTIVGSILDGSVWLPFIQYADGERIALPMPEWALNQNYPCGISNNEDIIGGYVGGLCVVEPGTEQEDSWGQSRPAFWVKGSDGEYEVRCLDHTELTLPEHQGTFVYGMYSDGTIENSYLYGQIGCGAGSYVPFIYNGSQELIMWNEITHEDVPYYYKGQIWGYARAELIDGKLDLYHSADDSLNAGLYGADFAGNIYGTRVEVYENASTDPADENFGLTKDRYYYGYYNVYTKEWTEKEGNVTVLDGLDGKYMFLRNGRVLTDGLDSEGKGLGEFLGTAINGSAISQTSMDGKVLASGFTQVDAQGVDHAYPVMIVLDNELVGIDNIFTDAANEQTVITYGGTIEVIGADEVAVYDMNGVNVANGTVSHVGSGMYIVVADGVSHKIMVK